MYVCMYVCILYMHINVCIKCQAFLHVEEITHPKDCLQEINLHKD